MYILLKAAFATTVELSRCNRPSNHKAKNVYHLIPYISSLWTPNLREEGKRITIERQLVSKKKKKKKIHHYVGSQ